MKTVQSSEALRRLALERGAVATISGKVTNAAGAQLNVRPKAAPAPAPEPEPVPAPEPIPSITLEEVEWLLRERDERWERRLEKLSASILMLKQQIANRPEPAAAPRKGATISFTTDLRGLITGATITPKE